MSKYMLEISYTLDGIRGVKAKGGTARVAAARAAIESAGGKLDALYFAFGNNDAYAIVDLPDHVAAGAVALTLAASGAVAPRTIVLLTPEEVDQAAARNVGYSPPSG